jgi:hypothetical protein
MRKRTLAGAALLFAAAFALASELITRDGVGAVEYVIGIVIVAALVALAGRLVLTDRRSRPA